MQRLITWTEPQKHQFLQIATMVFTLANGSPTYRSYHRGLQLPGSQTTPKTSTLHHPNTRDISSLTYSPTLSAHPPPLFTPIKPQNPSSKDMACPPSTPSPPTPKPSIKVLSQPPPKSPQPIFTIISHPVPQCVSCTPHATTKSTTYPQALPRLFHGKKPNSEEQETYYEYFVDEYGAELGGMFLVVEEVEEVDEVDERREYACEVSGGV